VNYRWTTGFSVAEVGMMTLQMHPQRDGPENIIDLATQKNRVKNLKINRKLHKNTVFIIIEEEKEHQTTYRVENLST
jgi:SHR-binding domain of vacuolar-sorting associated protein 13